MGSVRAAVAPSQSVWQLAWCLGYLGEGELPLYVGGLPNPERRLQATMGAIRRLPKIVERLDLERSVEVAIGLPQESGWVLRSTILWAWVTGSKQVERAVRFKPMPSIVLRIGANSSERLLIWVLRNPVSDQQAERLNRRVSYCLGAPYTRSKPAVLRVPLPGTFARAGRARPAPILLTRLELGVGHTAESVAGRLKEPPPKDAWRERAGRSQNA